MVKVIGVRFRTAGKIYFFDPGKLKISRNDHVIVETARGIEYGTVVGSPREVPPDKVIQPLKPVLRIATERDDEQEANNKKKEKEAFKICLEKIRKHGLEMKLCCHSYLSEFIPVSIKMAKEQNLSLNPTKISGVCGRLMCCLKHEEETYEELNRRLPNVGDRVTTDDGFKGEVHSVNVLRQLVKVLIDVDNEKELREYKVEQLRFRRKHRHNKVDVADEELKALEKLEREEPKSKLEDN